MANGQQLPDGLSEEIERHIDTLQQQAGKRFGDPREPAARLGALGRRGLDARDDGHDPQPRPERRRGRGARLEHGQPALRLRLVPPADPDVRRGRRGRRRAPLRAGADRPQGRARRAAGRRARRERPARAGRHLQAALRGRDRQPVPAGRARPAGACRASRLRLVGHAAGAGLPPRAPDRRRPRHRRQRRRDGLRQQGRGLRHRRRVHARPVHRRAGALRRVSRRRAGRGRGRRDPDAAAAGLDGAAAAGGVRPADRHHAPARGALQGRAGHRVHGRGGPALPAADALGQAHRRRRAEGGGLDGGRGPDLTRGGRRPDRPGAARPAAAPDDRPVRAARGRRARPERLAGRGLRRGRARRRPRRGARQGGGERDPRPLGDDPGRHPRPDPGRGDPDRARRDDLARGRRGARDGQALRRRLRGADDRPRQAHARDRRRSSSPRATRSRSTAAPAGS